MTQKMMGRARQRIFGGRRGPSLFSLLCLLYSLLLAASLSTLLDAQEEAEGGGCPAGFYNKTGKEQCEDECDKEYYFASLFTYGACVNAPIRASERNSHPSQCSLACGIRLYLWTIIAIFAGIAASLVVLILLLPMCVTNCLSCLHSKKASKHSRRIATEQQQPSKEQQQMATLSYNPYAYWPYYGR